MVQLELLQAGGLSSREMNRARRKARQAIFKQRSRETGEDGGSSLSVDDPTVKRPKLEEGARDMKQEDGLFDSVPDSTGSWGEVSHKNATLIILYNKILTFIYAMK